MSWYLYVNKESLQVCKVSPILEEDAETHILSIDQELGISFIESPHLIREYLIYFDGDVVHFIKKEKNKDGMAQFFYSPIIIQNDVENAELTLKSNGKTIEFALRKDVIPYASNMYSSIEGDKRYVEFYVSAKNDPNHLYDIVKVNMVDLIKTGKSKVPCKHDLSKVSIFTRKIFKSYSINTNKIKDKPCNNK